MYLLIGIFIGNTKIFSRLLIYKMVSEQFIGRVMSTITFLSLIFSTVISVTVALVAEQSIIFAYLIICVFMLLQLAFIRLGLQEDVEKERKLHCGNVS